MDKMKTVGIVKDKTDFWPHYKAEFEKHGFRVTLYDIRRHEEQQRLLADPIDAFIWRAKHTPKVKRLARRFLYFYDRQIGIPTYPDWNAYWHYDDKIAQSYLMQKYDIASPETFISFDEDDALAWAGNAEYPLIYKYPHGSGSSNVGLLDNKKQAGQYIKKIFRKGVKTFFKDERQKGFVYLQQFIPGNEGDFKIVCYGDHTIMGLFRYNMEDRPMASSSNNYEVRDLPVDLLEFISGVNRKMGYHVMSYDVLQFPDGRWCITELSVIFGDLNYKIYEQLPIYYKRKGTWQKEEMKDNRVERIVRLLLKEVWGWI